MVVSHMNGTIIQDQSGVLEARGWKKLVTVGDSCNRVGQIGCSQGFNDMVN
jgi:hypothetical protein